MDIVHGPEDAIGFSVMRMPHEDIRRYVVFSDMNMIPEEDISPILLDAICQRVPFLDKERRASHLPTALLMQLRTCLEKQDQEISNLQKDTHMENISLRKAVFEKALENNEEKVTNAILAENIELRETIHQLQGQIDVSPFRDHLDKSMVASLQANVLRMSGAIWSFAPVGQQLGDHNDPHVRKCYETNLSLLTMLQENCESALQNCQDLLS